jgi:hypothetical protein
MTQNYECNYVVSSQENIITITTMETLVEKALLEEMTKSISRGDLVPYLGPYSLQGVTNVKTGDPIPADSDSLILAMNKGTPMAPRLMYEFPRAAMNLELKRGRKFVEDFLTTTYGDNQWTQGPMHRWIASLNAPYVIDINRDTQLQDLYSDREYLLILGTARISATDYRFKLFHHNNGVYTEIEQKDADQSLPVLFKPMGSPVPQATYVAADADYVDYITELMGGFAIPDFLKKYRIGKRYLLLGLPLTRDTERMVLSDLIYGANEQTGFAFISDPNKKEARFCANKNIELISEDCLTLLDDSSEKAAAVG